MTSDKEIRWSSRENESTGLGCSSSGPTRKREKEKESYGTINGFLLRPAPAGRYTE